MPTGTSALPGGSSIPLPPIPLPNPRSRSLGRSRSLSRSRSLGREGDVKLEDEVIDYTRSSQLRRNENEQVRRYSRWFREKQQARLNWRSRSSERSREKSKPRSLFKLSHGLERLKHADGDVGAPRRIVHFFATHSSAKSSE